METTQQQLDLICPKPRQGFGEGNGVKTKVFCCKDPGVQGATRCLQLETGWEEGFAWFDLACHCCSLSFFAKLFCRSDTKFPKKLKHFYHTISLDHSLRLTDLHTLYASLSDCRSSSMKIEVLWQIIRQKGEEEEMRNECPDNTTFKVTIGQDRCRTDFECRNCWTSPLLYLQYLHWTVSHLTKLKRFYFIKQVLKSSFLMFPQV